MVLGLSETNRDGLSSFAFRRGSWIGCPEVANRESLPIQPRFAGPDDDPQPDALLLRSPPLPLLPVRRRPPWQARPWPTPPSASSRLRRLPVKTTGQGRAPARGLPTKCAIEQVDLLLSNQVIERWGIECGPRGSKDPRLRLGLGSLPAGTPGRRDRLCLLDAVAIALPTMFGAAGEAL